MSIEINTKLLEKYFLLSGGHNVLFNINDESNIFIEPSFVKRVLTYLESLIEKNKTYSGLYSLDTKEEIFFYLTEYYYHTFKKYQNNFDNREEFENFIMVCLALKLTLFSQNGLHLLTLIDEERFDGSMRQKIFSFVDSKDSRGLLYYICQKNSIPYDHVMNKELVLFEYTEPSINKKWQKQYKEDGQPIVFWLYQSLLGKGLFLVLFGPKCRYKLEKGGCAGCNLPTVSSDSQILNSEDIKSQIENTLQNSLSDEEKYSFKELVLSNNGSILDPKTIEKSTLSYVVLKTISYLPNLKKIIFETRIDEYTDFVQLKELSLEIGKTNPNIKIELAIGFEIFNDELRNGYYKKGLNKHTLEQKIAQLSQMNISLKVYMMFKAVPDKLMSLDESIDDINNASVYFSKLSKQYNVDINLHISPTYLATGTKLYKDYKDNLYTPLTTKDIKKLFDEMKCENNLSYYISMNDEGLTDDRLVNESDYNEYTELKQQIHKFNIEQYKV
jgi:radical SAM enzyme (TIGR01210 family)